jgi:hypothetical protein
MAFTSLKFALSDWFKKRKLEKFFNENGILEVANEYLKEQKKRVKITSQRKKSASEN